MRNNQNKNIKTKIILASASERRRDILGLTGLQFTVEESGVEEVMSECVPPRRLARLLSRQKAEAVAAREKEKKKKKKKGGNALVIAADTFISINGRYLGKAQDQAEASAMLRALSGRAHLVVTGYTVIDSSSGKRISGSSETKVYFRRLHKEEIESYVKTGEPIGKAGAYAIQGLGAALVRKIEGDFFNVVGLPLSALIMTLNKFGIRIL
ncbi:MAG: Maf family protein [Nitrospiraceae bacterium]|nr:Maf family protein [Nitrospiraceae bacterium]